MYKYLLVILLCLCAGYAIAHLASSISASMSYQHACIIKAHDSGFTLDEAKDHCKR